MAKKQDNTMLWIGLAGLAAYYWYQKKQPVTVPTAVVATPGASTGQLLLPPSTTVNQSEPATNIVSSNVPNVAAPVTGNGMIIGDDSSAPNVFIPLNDPVITNPVAAPIDNGPANVILTPVAPQVNVINTPITPAQLITPIVVQPAAPYVSPNAAVPDPQPIAQTIVTQIPDGSTIDPVTGIVTKNYREITVQGYNEYFEG
jgi:hypothetical protein